MDRRTHLEVELHLAECPHCAEDVRVLKAEFELAEQYKTSAELNNRKESILTYFPKLSFQIYQLREHENQSGNPHLHSP